MKRIVFTALIGALFALTAWSQTDSQAAGSAQEQPSGTAPQASAPAAAAPSDPAPNANLATTPLQSGSIIYAELAKSVDSKKAKVGDEVQARTTQAALSQGRVVIPKGAKIIGHITQVTQRSGDQKPQLAFNFDHALLKDGTQIPLAVSVQALGGGASAVSAYDPSTPNMGGNRGPTSSGMPGRSASEAGPSYGAPGGNMGGMGSTSAGASATPSTGGVSTTDSGPATVHLNAGSKGVVGLAGLAMSSSTPQGTVITSDKKNVKLDGGIELVLRAN
jgi:hypothetical protein